MKEWKRLLDSFRFAVEGILSTFLHEKNMRIHGWMGVFVSILSWWAQITWLQYLVVLFMIIWVWIMELINTALEKTLDTISRDHHPLIKTAKDAAAGAVLLSAGFTVVVGISILSSPLSEKVFLFHQYMIHIVPTAGNWFQILIVWLIFIGILIPVRKRSSNVTITPVIGSMVLFGLFLWSNHPLLQMITLFLPIIAIIFLRRGFAFLYGCLQIAFGGSTIYLLYWITKSYIL